MSSLVWTPVYRTIEERIHSGDDIILIIVPFIKLDALRQLHWVQTERVRLKVVCRWRPSDLLSGASDVEVFPYLKSAGCELYLNPDVHLKLYVFGSNKAFNTSANLTLRGLGYSSASNMEVGNVVTLASGDWESIFRIIASSRQVDDNIYARYKDFVEKNQAPASDKMPVDLLGEPKKYTIGSLPATVSPAKLVEYYLQADHSGLDPEVVRRGIHDLVTFKIPAGLTATQLSQRLGDAFRTTPFVRDFVELLRAESSLRFGAVNKWIHDKCEDVPLPYRWEIKANTRIFYDWLAHYFPEITWERPHHSQIIRWS